MKLATGLIFLLLLFADEPFFLRFLFADANLAQKSESAEKRRRRSSPEALRRSAENPWNKMLESIDRTIGKRFPLFSGLALMAAGVGFYFLRARRKQQRSSASVSIQQKIPLALLGILVVGAILRLYGLDDKSLDHTEIFVPGISLPQDISAPPPRITWSETVWWHFHVEPHPPGYYFLMWPWTKILGTSEFVLRFPSVLFGVASIWVIFQIVLMTHSRSAAIFAAALLALNGHHIFWSQMARMYSMTCFLGLLSSWFLLRIAFLPDRSLLLEAGYAGASFVGLFTEILFWPFLAVQAFWAGIALRNQTNQPDRILRLQTIVMMIGTPLWAHAVYRARPSPLAEPSLSFLQHFFIFGFAIHPDLFAVEPQNVPLVIAISLLLVSLVLLFLASRKRGNPIPDQPSDDPGVRVTVPVAAGAILTTVGFSLLALSRKQGMAKTIVVPIAALFIPWVLATTGRIVRSIAQRIGFADFLKSPNLFYYLLAFIPGLGVFLLSYRFSLLGTRLFLLFVPFLLILIAIGLSHLQSRRILFALAVVILFASHVYSVGHYQKALSTPIDYKELAKEIDARFQEGDLIFVRAKHWGVTPLFYYLPEHQSALITQEFDRAITERQPKKVFLIGIEGLPPTPPMERSVQGFSSKEVVKKRRAYADIYSR